MHRSAPGNTSLLKKSILIGFLCLIGLGGCSYVSYLGTQPLFPGVSNRGIIPVSTSNAYVGSNLFLSDQMQKSPELYHFIESRGAPHAIRVNERESRSPELILYYPREDALYIGELIASMSRYNWIMRGPHKIPRYEMSALNQPAIDATGEPVLVFFDRILRFPPAAPPKSLRTIALPKIPSERDILKPTLSKATVVASKPKVAPRKTTRAATKSKAAPAKESFKPLNTDQMAILMSQGFAERDKNGDVIHTVKADSETIEGIAKWYTNDPKNSEAIIKATGLEGIKSVTKGLRVRIPFALVKNTKQMPTQ